MSGVAGFDPARHFAPGYDRGSGFYGPDHVRKLKGLGQGAKLIYERLARMAGSKGYCWPGHESLAADLGMGVSTVRAHLERLRQQGFLEWQRGGRRHESKVGMPNRYFFLKHPAFPLGSPGHRSKAFDSEPKPARTNTFDCSKPSTRNRVSTAEFGNFECSNSAISSAEFSAPNPVSESSKESRTSSSFVENPELQQCGVEPASDATTTTAAVFSRSNPNPDRGASGEWEIHDGPEQPAESDVERAKDMLRKARYGPLADSSLAENPTWNQASDLLAKAGGLEQLAVYLAHLTMIRKPKSIKSYGFFFSDIRDWPRKREHAKRELEDHIHETQAAQDAEEQRLREERAQQAEAARQAAEKREREAERRRKAAEAANCSKCSGLGVRVEADSTYRWRNYWCDCSIGAETKRRQPTYVDGLNSMRYYPSMPGGVPPSGASSGAPGVTA